MNPSTPPLSRRNSHMSESSHTAPSASAVNSAQNSPILPRFLVDNLTSVTRNINSNSSFSSAQNDAKQSVRFQGTQPQEPFVEMTTGLLSLSVHEPLTFSGTKIALHPDLFANFIHCQQQQQPGLERTGVKGLQMDSAVPPSPSIVTATTEVEYNDGTTPPSSEALRKRSCMLEPGDLIEIRVWDVVKDATSVYASSTVLRPSGVSLSGNKQSRPLDRVRFAAEAASSSGAMTQEASATNMAATRADSPSSRGHESVYSSNTNMGQLAYPSPTDKTTSDAPSFTSSTYLYKTRPDIPYGGKILMEFPASSLSSGGTTGAGSGISADEDHGAKCGSSRVYELRTSFIMKVGKHTLSAIKENSRSQISLLRQGMLG